MGKSATGPQAWPGEERWLDPAVCAALQIDVVSRARLDIGIAEKPLGSNRSPTIDALLRRARVDEETIASGRGYWCGAWAGACLEDAGAEIPDWYADCDEWVKYLKESGLWIEGAEGIARPAGLEGYVVLYGVPGDASHIGIVTRWDRLRYVTQGNTTANGYSDNGVCCAEKTFSPHAVLGFGRPIARAA